MSSKEAIIVMIRQMPEDATSSDVMDELFVRQKIEAGIKELDNGDGIPHNENIMPIKYYTSK